MKTDFRPCIYTLQPAYFKSRISADHSAWDPLLGRCVAMGFDHILITLPTTEAVEDKHGMAELSASRLLPLLQACARHKLRLLLDLRLNRMPAHHPLPRQYPHYFTSGCHQGHDTALPDPRTPATLTAWRFAKLDCPEVAAFLQEYWQQQLRDWIEAGVAGFRCLALAQLPASFWTTLISASRRIQANVCFLAWTCGATPQQLGALEGCGFDASFSSVPWWNFKAAWFTQEQSRLMRLAPAIAFPEAPEPDDSPSPAQANGSPALLRQACLRSLLFSAVAGQGLMMPMGFEYGRSTHTTLPLTDDAALEKLQALTGWDLSVEIAAANHLVATLPPARLRLLSSPNAALGQMLRGEPGAKPGGLLIFINPDALQAQSLSGALWRKRCGASQPDKLLLANSTVSAHERADHQITLPAAAIRIYTAARTQPIVTASRQKSGQAPQVGPRIAIEAISPCVDGGRFAVKKILGDTVRIEATLLIEGSAQVAGALLWRCADQAPWQQIRMSPLGNDRWAASLPLRRLGRYCFAIEAWIDDFATFRQRLKSKVDARLDVALELLEGQQRVVQSARAVARHRAAYRGSGLLAALNSLERKLSAPTPDDLQAQAQSQIQLLLSPSCAAWMQDAGARPFAEQSAAFPIVVERRAAQYGNWYELFPRSQSAHAQRHGSFDDVIARLPAIRAMGFDTLYLPPIHPIGLQQRKGRNNALSAQPEDPGSPYAIGSPLGGA